MTWVREAAQKEVCALRRDAWALLSRTAGAFKQMPAEEFPAVHNFLRDLKVALLEIDHKKDPSESKRIDIEAVAIRNPKYWTTVYEVEPAHPLMMWFHPAHRQGLLGMHASKSHQTMFLFNSLNNCRHYYRMPGYTNWAYWFVSSLSLIVRLPTTQTICILSEQVCDR